MTWGQSGHSVAFCLWGTLSDSDNTPRFIGVQIISIGRFAIVLGNGRRRISGFLCGSPLGEPSIIRFLLKLNSGLDFFYVSL